MSSNPHINISNGGELSSSVATNISRLNQLERRMETMREDHRAINKYSRSINKTVQNVIISNQF